MERDQRQEKVNSMLRRGVLFSIFWLMGVGSLIAIIQGIKAQRIIRQSNGEIKGTGKVWWCFVVGGTGLLFWGYVFIMVIIRAPPMKPHTSSDEKLAQFTFDSDGWAVLISLCHRSTSTG